MSVAVDEAPSTTPIDAAAAALADIPAPAPSAGEGATAPARGRKAARKAAPRKRAGRAASSDRKPPAGRKPAAASISARVRALLIGSGDDANGVADMLALASPVQGAILRHNAERWGTILETAAARNPAARRLIEGLLTLGDDTGTLVLLALCVAPHLAVAGVLPGKAGELVPMVATMAGTMPADLPGNESPLAGLAGLMGGATGADLADTINLNGNAGA